MSGHSKWATIKHKKAKEDSKRGKIFTKLIREITVAAREGGGDTIGNAKLRLVIEKAKSVNMPQDNITRAIKKGSGGPDGGANYEAMTYEGYGPHGIALIIEILSDNKNRIASEIRHIFSKTGGNLAEGGAVAWMFEHKGVIRATSNMTEDDLIEKLLDYNVDDIDIHEGISTITCKSQELESIKKATTGFGMKLESSGIEWVPKTTVPLAKEQEEKVYALLETIEDLDDVQNVYANIE